MSCSPSWEESADGVLNGGQAIEGEDEIMTTRAWCLGGVIDSRSPWPKVPPARPEGTDELKKREGGREVERAERVGDVWWDVSIWR